MHIRVVTPPYIRIHICWTDIGHELIQQYATAASAASDLNVEANAAAGVSMFISRRLPVALPLALRGCSCWSVLVWVPLRARVRVPVSVCLSTGVSVRVY